MTIKKRENEIAFAMELIYSICEKAEIEILCKEVKNKQMIVIRDIKNLKEYALIKK